jgi:hypothetical protein
MLEKPRFEFVICFALAQILSGAYAMAADTPARRLLQDELKARTPADWQVHVSDRGDTLLAFVTPPYQQAFDLWYEPAQLKEKMLGLCPTAGDAVWSELQPGRSIVIQPTVGGKSADGVQLVCPRSEPRPPA